MPAKLFIGLDLGTSGARAIVIDAAGKIVGSGKSAMADFGANFRDPSVWRAAAFAALDIALAGADRSRIAALAVDGTSGTLVGLDASGATLGDALMYNDASPDANAIAAIAGSAPSTSAAHGQTSGLAKAIALQGRGAVRAIHQADWIASLFSGRVISDANNALKTGYDPVAGRWPDWIFGLGVESKLLPPVVEPGSAVGPITGEAGKRFDLPRETRIVAGTTDGCASFLATGASQPGDGVTALGTTLTLKLLSDKPIFAPEYGIYSHRILGQWLAGGASNTGGGALLAHFTAEEMAALTPRLDPATPTGLAYYPLTKHGERFPIADPNFAPRLEPRPADPVKFLQGLLEGIAEVEALGYRRLAELGAPRLSSVRSVGGGAQNRSWTDIRGARLKVPMLDAVADEAAYGAALLARSAQ